MKVSQAAAVVLFSISLHGSELQIRNFSISAEQIARFEIFGSHGSNYQAQASVDFENWIRFPGAQATNGSFPFSDPNRANFSGLFYRAAECGEQEVPRPLGISRSLKPLTVKKLISPAGGMLQLTDQDGAFYELTIPTNSLLLEMEISMTVIGSATLPFSGGLVAGVELEPSGLVLVAPATLRIRFPTSAQAAEMLAFVYHGKGTEFHMAPARKADRELTLFIHHFSGAGVGRGTAGDSQAQTQNRPTNPLDRGEQTLANIQTQADTTGEDPATTEAKVVSTLQEMFKNEVRPRLKTAEKNCGASKDATRTFLRWHKLMSLLGVESQLTAEFQQGCASLGPIIRNCGKELHDRCVSEHDPAVVGGLLELHRTAALLGGWVPDQGVQSYLEDLIYKCLQFELDFESIVEAQDSFPSLGNTERWTAHLKTTRVKLRAQGDILTALTQGFEGQGSLDYLSFTIINQMDTGCVYYDFVTVDAINKVRNLKFNGRVNAGGDLILTPLLIIEPGEAQDSYMSKCPEMDPSRVTLTLWYGTFHALHEDELIEYSGVVINDWSVNSGSPLFARKIYDRARTYNMGVTRRATEMTTFDLWHVPQP